MVEGRSGERSATAFLEMMGEDGPDCWTVVHNSIAQGSLFDEDLVQVQHNHKPLLVDMGWYGGCRQFIIRAYEGDCLGPVVDEERASDLIVAAFRLFQILARHA